MVSDLSRHCEQQGLVLSHVIEEALLLGLRDMGIAVRTFAGVINEDEDDQHDDDNS